MSPRPTLTTVRDVMTPEPVCVSPATTLRQLARVLEEHEISGAPVVDHTGRVVGVVSKSDLIRRCSEGTRDIPPAYLFEAISGGEGDREGVMPEPLICVQDFMTDDPLLVPESLAATAAARLMHDRRIHRLIVTDADRFPIGIVTSLDLLGLLGK